MNPHDPELDIYKRDGIASGASIVPGMMIENRGSVGEYNLSLGMNFDSKLDFGFSVSIQHIYLLRKIYYDESYTLGNIAVLAVDYECTWYNGMRLPSDDRNVRDDYMTMIKEGLLPVNSFKLGLEVKPIPVMALRAGFSHYSSPIDTENNFYSKFIMTRTNNISAGLGFGICPNVNLDIAYRILEKQICRFRYFLLPGNLQEYARTFRNTSVEVTTANLLVNDLVLHRHTTILSLNFLF